MLLSAGIATTNQQAMRLARDALDSGRAAECFGRMVALLGGPADFLERMHEYLPAAPFIRTVEAEHDGFVREIITRDIGLAVVDMGGGRTRPQDSVDHAVGLTEILPVGAEVRAGDPLAVIHARSEDQFHRAAQWIRNAYAFSETRPAPARPVQRRIGARY
jgi:thymidine phosphorylase